MVMSKIEGHVAFSVLERRTAAKYYYFMLVNVFLGSIVTGTTIEQLYSFPHQSPTQSQRFGFKMGHFKYKSTQIFIWKAKVFSHEEAGSEPTLETLQWLAAKEQKHRRALQKFLTDYKKIQGEGAEDGYEFLNHKAKQRVVSSNFAINVISGISCQELASTLEPLIRGWVRDEVQRACQSFCCSSPRSPFNALDPCGVTPLQLRFLSKLPQMLFTGSRVESKDSSPVKVVLFDTDANKIVSSGPLSSLKIQIVPLDVDFSPDDDEDWSPKDFEAKVIFARDGKRPLVAGDLVVALNEGVGDLGEVFFTDNSSWRRSRTFRIGAQAISKLRIREARSEPFVVKDHRGESYKKHHPPALNDDIWRLEKIAKDGAFHKRLGSYKICTVKDFLQIYVTNEASLRKILGWSCNKTWDTIIKHANNCVLDDKLYIYNCGAQGVGLVFNSVFRVVGATLDGQNYLSCEELNVFQMQIVESTKQQFYKNLNGMLPMDDLSVFGASMLTSNLLGDPLKSSANLLLQDVNIPTLHPGI